MKRVALLFLISMAILQGNSLKCEKKNNTITCTYFSDRSDNPNGIKLKFDWISPISPQDDRIRYIEIPPYYGSAYDYRFLPGRAIGKWRVVVTRTDNNETIQSSFEINATDDEFFN